MTLRLLGGAQLDGPLAPDLSLWLCAVLALRDTPLSREALAALLWPEASPQSAHNRLRQLLHRTRRSRLGAGLHAEASGLRWGGPSDVERFRAASAAGRWDEAVEAYGGPLLDGLPLPESEALTEWLSGERAQLHDQYLAALARAAEAHETAGRPQLAAERLEALLVQDALHEEAVSALMRCLEGLGSPPRALAVYERYRRELEGSFGVMPSPALEAQARRLRRAAPAATGVLRGAPARPTRFLGRERELALAGARLSDPATRWLTLSGPGGVGKTSLALELATRLAPDHPQGALFVALAGVAAAHLPQAVLAALGLPLQGGRDPDEQLREALSGQRLLLVLDNFEHMQEAAPLLPGWLAAAPGLRLLVTSRHRLDFQAEWALRLEPLEVEAQAGAPLESAAARLFIERASRADLGFEPQRHSWDILRICRRCEGLPLALELAAAWVGTCSPSQLADALEEGPLRLSSPLRDVEGRHRSLWRVFEHAWGLLPPRLRTLYARLAVLRTPFSGALARQLAGAEATDLRELERRSLLVADGEGRHRWHQNLRELAWAQLDPAEQREGEGRHLDAFLALAQELAPGLRGPRQAELHARLAEVHDDLRAALSSAQVLGQWDKGLALSAQLHWFWYVRGHHAEGLAWLDLFLAPFEGEGQAALPPDPTLALALKAGGSLACERGEFERARGRYERALSISRALGDRAREAELLHVMGVLERDTGQLERAGEQLRAALALREQLDEPGELGTTLNDLGILCARLGDREGAREHFRLSLHLKEEAGDRQGVAYALGNLGAVTDDLHEELGLYRRSLAIKRELGDVQGCANTTFNCACVATDLDQLAEARAHFEEALTLYLRLGKTLHLGSVLAELTRWLERVGEGDAALTLVAAALGLERHIGVSLPEHTRAALEARQDRLAGLPEGVQRLAEGRALTPTAALELALQAVQAADPSEKIHT